MYEREANNKTESAAQIPAEIASQFGQLTGTVLERTVLPWSEHCTECVWPTCYTTCDLYSPREDGRCRRFSDGMVRVDCAEALNSYVLKIRFKRWGKLWTPGNIRLRSMRDAQRAERRDYWIGKALIQLPVPMPLKTMATQKRYSFKKRMAYRGRTEDNVPTAFVLECYNPSPNLVRLSLTMRSVDDRVKIPFQQLIELRSGYHRIRVGYDQITQFLDLGSPFNIDLAPNEDQMETTLYFGVMDFVREARSSETTTAKEQRSGGPGTVKCLVWDLDNTLWDGVLVEDGPAKLRLKPHIVQVLKALDERGILHSIASKNNRDEALGVLKNFGIQEYFLCPQISWQPKSESIEAIGRQLNIGIDTLLFVDDSEFELQQVRAAHPKVRVLNAERYLEIADMEMCQVPVSAESRERRKMYQVESQRQDIAGDFGDDYIAFLRHCNIRLNISSMTGDNLTRVHELTQRTNQMNFSGNRYEKSVLERILSNPYLDTYVLDVEDRFGAYGVVGFCIVDNRVPLMTDLMFSCRVQSKRVEHAFLAHIIRKYIAITGKDFYANYRKSPRNAPSGRVFADLLLEETGEDDGVSRLMFPNNREVPDDGIIDVVVHNAVEAIKS
ncbi:MAG: HAD-IIIC family phosphatase [Terracidiphilus sp.]|jgi:FkbH-like protein